MFLTLNTKTIRGRKLASAPFNSLNAVHRQRLLLKGSLLIAGFATGLNGATLATHYNLDETSGSSYADSAGSNDGALTGSATHPNGVLDNAIAFDGSSIAYLRTNSSIAVNNSTGFSIAAWIKADAYGTDTRIIAQQEDGSGVGRTWLGITTNGSLTSYVGGNSTIGGSINTGQWYHIAVTAGSGTIKIYLDGQEIDSSSLNVESNNAKFRFGSFKSSNINRQFDGSIDDVKLYTGVLTASEVQALATVSSGDIIVDNSSSSVTYTGSWSTSTTPGGYYGSNYRHDNNSGKGSKSVEYAPSLSAGNYIVYLHWNNSSSNANNVPVDINHADGTDYISVDMSQNGGAWVQLGTYEFDGTSHSVVISNDGTSGRVIADAVKFEPTSGPSNAQILATGMTAWRTPDGNGISCAECHTPFGYDVAVFDFNNADLRRATAPHLSDTEADQIFAMIELYRDLYPPSGGLKDVETFRPFQPANGVVLGGATSDVHTRDNAFADYLAANFELAQANVIDTLSEANSALSELVAVDLRQMPVGIAFNKWSESVSRDGVDEGGEISEWLPAMGLQPTSADESAWFALVDAYIANPTDANFWAMYHVIEDYLVPDPHNAAPTVGTTKEERWKLLTFGQFMSNNLFAHNELNKATGVSELDFTDGIQPFPGQVGQGGSLSVMWEVGDQAKSVDDTAFIELPQRNQDTLYNSDGLFAYEERINNLRLPWMWLGYIMDPVMWHSGTSTATLTLEYFHQGAWDRDFRMHNAFTEMALITKRGLLPNSWNPPSRWQDAGDYQNIEIRHGTPFTAYERYQKEEWDTGTTAYAAYRRWIANGYRAILIRQTWEIEQNGRHWNDETLLNNQAEIVRTALNWADSANETLNDQIVDDFKTAVANYPQ